MMTTLPPVFSKRMSSSFYKRQLPTHCIAFSSPEGRELLIESLQSSASYFHLAEQFHTQSEPAFCGLGTLVMVLNALQVDPGRQWKGPWRWFSERMLDCCKNLSEVESDGLTLDEFACLAACNGARCSVSRPSDPGVGAHTLRDALLRCGAADGSAFVIASYDRGGLQQTGSGHFSPLAAYHAGRDMVLILDVARFKYPPHWVPLPMLFEALYALDPSTGRCRGYAVVSRVGNGDGADVGSSCWDCARAVADPELPTVVCLVPPSGSCCGNSFFEAPAFNLVVSAAITAYLTSADDDDSVDACRGDVGEAKGEAAWATAEGSGSAFERFVNALALMAADPAHAALLASVRAAPMTAAAFAHRGLGDADELELATAAALGRQALRELPLCRVLESHLGALGRAGTEAATSTVPGQPDTVEPVERSLSRLAALGSFPGPALRAALTLLTYAAAVVDDATILSTARIDTVAGRNHGLDEGDDCTLLNEGDSKPVEALKRHVRRLFLLSDVRHGAGDGLKPTDIRTGFRNGGVAEGAVWRLRSQRHELSRYSSTCARDCGRGALDPEAAAPVHCGIASTIDATTACHDSKPCGHPPANTRPIGLPESGV